MHPRLGRSLLVQRQMSNRSASFLLDNYGYVFSHNKAGLRAHTRLGKDLRVIVILDYES